MEPTPRPGEADWEARVTAWRDRVARVGVERSIYHLRHKRAADFQAITRVQRAAIWPHAVAAVGDRRGVALDVGCGYGRWTPDLAALVGEAIGVDPTPELIAQATATRPAAFGARVRYALMVHGRIPVPDRSVDVLWVCMVLSTVLADDMFAATLEELRRVVREEAVIVLTDNTSRADGRPIHGKYSRSRTVEAYVTAFAPWATIQPVGQYVDVGEVNTVFTGVVRPDGRAH